MDKEEILNASRRDHEHKDLVELEIILQAGSHASRVGALVCCLLSFLSSMLARVMLYSPWVIYFSMMGTQWMVRYVKLRQKSDLLLSALFLSLALLALLGLVRRLLERGL